MTRAYLQKVRTPISHLLLGTLLVLFVELVNVPLVLGQQWVGGSGGTPNFQEGEDEDAPLLSPYWHPRLQQWDTLIVEEAAYRALDPDFLASLVWMESAGRPRAIGPKGAVGLTQVMPKEEGFSWRPSREVLMDPSVNLFWGTRTLATVIYQGRGNIFPALAAYNGGWEKVQMPGPRMFATEILRDYAEAIAMRYDMLPEEHWVAFFAISAPEIRGPIWVADSERDDVYFFGESNWLPDGELLIPKDISPASIVAYCEEDDGTSYQVGIWFYLADQDQWVSP